jgi:hypothetical protein
LSFDGLVPSGLVSRPPPLEFASTVTDTNEPAGKDALNNKSKDSADSFQRADGTAADEDPLKVKFAS